MVHGEPVGYPIPLLSVDLLKFAEGPSPQLRIQSWSDATRTLQLRGFNAHGHISHDHVTNSDRSLATTTIDITDTPIMLQVKASATGVKRCQCYVRVTLLFGGQEVTCLLQNYVHDEQYPCFPVMHSQGPLEGPGRLRAVSVANPAVATGWSYTIETNTRAKLICCQAVLTTDANVANRNVGLWIDTSNSSAVMDYFTINHAASLGRQYIWRMSDIPMLTAFNANNRAVGPLPIGLILDAGSVIETDTINIQAGDQWSNIQLFLEEWIEE